MQFPYEIHLCNSLCNPPMQSPCASPISSARLSFSRLYGHSGFPDVGCKAGKGNLDPTNATLYDVLAELIDELFPPHTADLFGGIKALHLGGEEVQWGCWANPRVEAWAKANGLEAGQGWAEDLPHKLYRRFWLTVWERLRPAFQTGRLTPIVWEDAVFEAPGLWAEVRGGEAVAESPVVELYKRPKYSRLSVVNTTAMGLRSLVTSGKQPRDSLCLGFIFPAV